MAEFMGEKLYEGGRLMARLCDGELRYEAQLDDYAFYALGLLELYRADFKAGHIASAQALAGQLLEDFADEKGGFFRTSRGAESSSSGPRKSTTAPCPLATVRRRCFSKSSSASPARSSGERRRKSSWAISAPPAPGSPPAAPSDTWRCSVCVRRAGTGLRPALRGAAGEL